MGHHLVQFIAIQRNYGPAQSIAVAEGHRISEDQSLLQEAGRIGCIPSAKPEDFVLEKQTDFWRKLGNPMWERTYFTDVQPFVASDCCCILNGLHRYFSQLKKEIRSWQPDTHDGSVC